MRISITGSEGFLGGVIKKLLSIPYDSQYDILTGKDITRSEVQDEIASKFDILIHLAALSGVKACSNNPDYAKNLNIDSTLELARKLKISGGKRFIFASSSAVYGEACTYKMDESHPVNPRSLYGQTKLAAEKILDLADKKFEIIIFRQSNLYGFGMKWKGITVIDQFIHNYLNKLPLNIIGTGSQKRDFVHVMDVMSLYSKVAQVKKVRSGIYNVGGTETYSIRALAELINDLGESILGYRVPIEFTPANNEVLWHDFKFDYSKAMMEFQYKPVMTLDDYIKERLGIAIRTS